MDQLSRTNLFLNASPKSGFKKSLVVGQKVIFHICSSNHKALKIFWEYIVFSDIIPRFGGIDLIICLRFWLFPKVHIRQKLNFIIIINNDPLLTGHIKVLCQHVTKENVGLRLLYNRIYIHLDGMAGFFSRAGLKIDV